MAPTKKAALARRHRQSAIVSRMVLTIFGHFHRDYSRKHIVAVCPDLLAAMAVRENDEFSGKPITISDIAKRVNIPRSNVGRAVGELVRNGVIEKEGRGYRGRLDYLQKRIDADYFKGIVRAVIEAADELKKNGGPKAAAALYWVPVLLIG